MSQHEIRHVLLLVIDCLRADHVSCYGYERETTPTLDTLAADGVQWQHASSTSSWTKPSVASLLTGLYPSEHGAFSGIKRSRLRPVATSDMLLCEKKTLAETFSDNRWRTAAFTNNAQLHPYTKLDRGFDTYCPQSGKADSILAAYGEWLAQAEGTPSLVYLHFLEAHWPYKPRRRHMAMFGGNRDTNHFRDYSARDFATLRREMKYEGRQLTRSQLVEIMQMYDAAVRRLDGKIKYILRQLEELDLRDSTAIFITADHGEEFCEHGRIGHGHSLYQELLHVPLVASVPGGQAAIRVEKPVSLVDLPRTMLATVGLDDGFPGYNLLDPEGNHRPAVAELRIKDTVRQSLHTNSLKLIGRFDSAAMPSSRTMNADSYDELQIFDLQVDPQEQHDLAVDGNARDRLIPMVNELNNWRSALERPVGDKPGTANAVEVEASVLRRIRDLGYID
ncbi:MAG: sulfatase [Planctomycetota bacterium]|jgi:arylsulfatase